MKIGETFTVHKLSIDEKSWEPKVYWICDCTADTASEFRDKGAECKAQLGPEAYNDVKAILDKDWVNNKLKVVRIKDYTGLGTKGIIWTGILMAEQARIAPSPDQPKRGEAFEVSDPVKIWLLQNKNIIGGPVPPDIANATDKAIFKELEELGLFFYKDYYPHLHKDAAQIIE